MPFRGPAELESMLNTRLYATINMRLQGENVVERLKVTATIMIKGLLTECVGNNTLLFALVKGDVDKWTSEMAELAVSQSVFDKDKTPQMQLNLKGMAEKVFEGHELRPRVPTSPFVRPGVGFTGIKPARTVQEQELALDLERRGLEEIILRPEVSKLEGRRRIGEGVQKALAEMETHRQKQLEEQKKIDQAEKELENTGFGRKVDLD